MQNMIMVIPEKCTGCYICQLACSFKHTGECRPSAARIAVISWDKIGVSTPVLCLQCDDAPCARVCPAGALKRTADGGVVLNETLCIKCKMCMIGCPFGNIKYDYLNQEIIKCDLCGGQPECVDICPSGALIYTSAVGAVDNKQEAYAGKLRGVPEEVGA